MAKSATEKHKQAWRDLDYLREATNGWPYDAGWLLEDIGAKIMKTPTLELAEASIISLIERYFTNGDCDGRPLPDDPRIIRIGKRYGF